MFKFIVQLIDAIVWPLFIVVLIWLAFFLNHGYDLGWNDLGLKPWDWSGLTGVITMPFLHGNFDHLFSNSIPLLLSMAFIFLYFPKTKWHIIGFIYPLTGILLWFIGREHTNHIGASGLVYAYIAFLITHAFINRNKQTLAAAFILIFLYGSLIYGIFPEYGKLIGKNISWEGHLSGAIFGVIFGILYRRKGPQAIKPPEDDDEDDVEWYYREMEEREHVSQQKHIRYHFRPNQESEQH